MEKSWLRLSVFTLILLLCFSFSCKKQGEKEGIEKKSEEESIAEEKTQNSSPVKVVCAKRTYLFRRLNVMGRIAESKINKEEEDGVILVLRLEGMTFDEFQCVPYENIYVINGDNKYIIQDFDEAPAFITEDKKISPWIVYLFAIPKNIKKMKLVHGDYPPVEFEIESKIFEILEKEDLISKKMAPY